VDQSAESLL
jgi:hypothetical protein